MTASPTQPDGKRFICILGGGISGLSLAWYLLHSPGGKDLRLMVLEKEVVPGGNARTLPVDLGKGAPQGRWADMGVNDYNAVSYKLLVDLMVKTGYGEGNKLEDTEAYGNSDGSVCYTNDGERFTQMSPAIAAGIKRFQDEAPGDVDKAKYKYYTVERYVLENGYSKEFIYHNLYPRINGMYFCAGAPGEMPFRAVMHYYMLQEGYEGGKTPTPDRRYFKNGTSSWIESLRNALNREAGYQVVHTSANASVEFGVAGSGRQLVRLSDGQTYFADDVVMAMHADDALAAFTDLSKVPQDIIDVLVRFPYVPSTAVVHTDSRVFQPGVNSLRTYNIHVFDFEHDSYGPYTISYVANRHQNDCQNPAYKNLCENPQYFISLSPTVWPAPHTILNQPDGKPALFRFKHQKLSNDMLLAQERYLPPMQGKYNLWYCNGYCLGAGLHEECLNFALHLSRKMLGLPPLVQIFYGEEGENGDYAPDYIKRAHDETYNPHELS